VRRRWPSLVALLLLVCLVSGSRIARAEEVEYSSIDRATVRVFALGAPALLALSNERESYLFGVPLGGHGSGVLVSESGLVLTAAHVVGRAKLVAVQLPGEEYAVPAKVLFVNTPDDYAFLQLASASRDAAELAAADERMKVRQEVFVVGYPLDSSRRDPQSSRGVVSGLMPNGHLQLDVSVNRGNSGGPVLCAEERVCAIVVARADPDQGAVGIAEAIPVKAFRAKFEEFAARKTGEVHTPRRSERSASPESP
jgi:S1-C subfamily serine protease